MIRKRKEGDIHPGIKWGPFTARIPGVHLEITPNQHLQGGLLLLATCGSITPLAMKYFDISLEVAWTVSLVFLVWVLAQTILFGDVYAAGAITPALPLTIVYLNTLTPGIEAVHGMIAISIVVIALFLFFGITRLGEKFNNLIPASLKAGIIMGAAIAAFQSELGRLPNMPITLITAWVIVLLLMFSIPFASLPDTKAKVIAGSNALLIAFSVAGVVGFFTGEVTFDLKWGIFVPPIGEVFSTLSIWSVGLPPLEMIISVIPLGFMFYILVFGDLLVAQTLLKDADEARKDEKIDINMNRSHYVLALRNLGQILTAGPMPWLHGPIWTGVQVFLIQRYKKGRNTMDSIFSGVANFYLLAIPLGLLLPVMGIIAPLFPVALSVTILLTGFACAYVAMSMVTNNISRGLVLMIGMLCATLGAAWGIGIGIALYILLIGRNKENLPSEKEKVVEEKQEKIS
ncbi:hypothetical protein ACJ2A9_16295 [Anaerobacillus sp. MEB173]|uniref:hypothetical protein n=1 Tax=Anaerobacillus sp. MEB173 TaxID=3383345 RepID=UPI003F91C7A8